jgi:hypothetical protein
LCAASLGGSTLQAPVAVLRFCRRNMVHVQRWRPIEARQAPAGADICAVLRAHLGIPAAIRVGICAAWRLMGATASPCCIP